MPTFNPQPLDIAGIVADRKDRDRRGRIDTQRGLDRLQDEKSVAFQRGLQMAQNGLDMKTIQSAEPDIPGNKLPVIEHIVKQVKQRQKVTDAETEFKAQGRDTARTDKLAGQLNTAESDLGTQAQKDYASGQLESFGAAGGDMGRLESRRDTLGQEAAAKAQQQVIDNRSDAKKRAIEMFGPDDWRTEMIADHEQKNQSPFTREVIDLENAGVLEPGTGDRMRARKVHADLAKAESAGETMIVRDADGNILFIKGDDASAMVERQDRNKKNSILQERYFANDISLLYMKEMKEVLVAGGEGVVGLTGTLSRVAQRAMGRLDDIDRLFGTETAREFRTMAQGANTAARQKLAGTDYEGARPVKFQKEDGSPDNALAARVERSILDFDPNNARMKALSFLIAFNIVSARQRGTRVVTGKAIELMEKELGLRSANSVEQIIESVDVMIRNGEITKRFFEAQFKQFGGTPISADPRDVNTKALTDVVNESIQPKASGALNALGPAEQVGPELPPGVTITEIQ